MEGSSPNIDGASREDGDAPALRPETERWVSQLPESVRPRRLAVEYPRIANELASVWGKAKACTACLDQLLIDRRGERSGFSSEIALELATLKDYVETVLYPTAQSVWDELIARQRRD
jgi:hypothetical protein